MDTQVEKPTDISFTSDDIAKHSTRPSLTDGWYQWICTQAETTVAKSGHLMIDTRNAPLAEADDPSSKVAKFAVRDNIILPFDNPNMADHKAPNTAGLCHAKLMAIFGEDEIPDYPRVVDGVLTYKGEEIQKVDEQAYREEVTALVFHKLQELWQDPTPLVDQAFFAKKIQNGEFSNLTTPRAVLPDGVELVARSSWEAVTTPASKATASKNGTNGHGKTNGKTNTTNKKKK